MGYMTVVCILNDAWDTLKKNKNEFFEKVEQGMLGRNNWNPTRSVNSYGVGNHCNPIEVTRSFHADCTQLYLVGQNCMTDLMSTSGLDDAHIGFLIDAQESAKIILDIGEKNVCEYVVKQIRPLVTKEMSSKDIEDLIKKNDVVKANKDYFTAKKIKYIVKSLS